MGTSDYTFVAWLMLAGIVALILMLLVERDDEDKW